MSWFEQLDSEVKKVRAVTDLKPCPCCGGSDLYFGVTSSIYFGVMCTNNECGLKIEKCMPEKVANGDNPVVMTMCSAADAWNRRGRCS